MQPSLSVIIPVLHEGDIIASCISSIQKSLGSLLKEIIIVDGAKDTLKALHNELPDCSVKGLCSVPGRGQQLQRGAQEAKGDSLLFLHADSTLPPDAESVFLKSMFTYSDWNKCLWAFSLRLNKQTLPFRMVEKSINLRNRLFSLPYGDQGYFIARDLYDQIGGFADLPILEDADFVSRCKRKNIPVLISPHTITTSTRRWEKEGIVKRTIQNWTLLTLWKCGFSPQKLNSWYT